jgi:hypothetical protein
VRSRRAERRHLDRPAAVGPVEEQQVLALDREDERFRVVRVTQRIAAEHGMQQEQRE